MDSYYSPSGSATRSASAKWVCPNDRQLALRAKLRTGWSVKSSSLDSRSFDYFRYSTTTTTTSCPGSLSTKSSSNSNQPLTEEERERIIEVIKKADALDLSEQERVGRLVDRLENMKRNVTVVTSTRANGRSCGSRCIRGNICVCCCALCGEKFTVLLGAAPGLCHDCRKYVCQKCGIETNTQSSSSSSSSSTNNNHQQKRRQQQFTGSTTNINTSDNTKPSPSTPPAKIFLCRICTETREMWKKSGAWFFKSLPKYVLPEKKPKSGSRGSHWTLAGGSKSLEPSELDSSSDEDFSRRPTRTRSFLFYSKSLDPPISSAATEQKSNGNHLDIETDPVIMSSPSSSLSPSRKGSFLNLNAPDQAPPPPLTLSPQNQLTVPNISSAFSTSPSSLSPSPSSSLSPVVPRSRSSSRLRDQKEQCSSQSSIFYIPFSIGSCESVNNDSTIQINKDKDNNTAKTGGGGRKSSIQSRELNDNNIDTTGFRKSRRTSINNSSSSNNEKENQRDQDHIPHQVSQLGMEKNNEMKNYGKLEITLRYEPLYHCLQCKVERARGLRPMDIHGHTDSYCKLIVLPQQQEDNNKTTAIKCQRTKTIYNTRDPLFNEQFNFYEIIENDLKTNKALHVLILLDDAAGRDFLGEAKFPLRELLPCQTKYYNVLLEDQQQQQQRENMMMIWGEDLTNARGTIQLSLIYSTRRRALLVNIQRANNLLAMDTNGLSDPFVKLCLTRDIMKNDLNLKSPATTVSLAPPVNKKQLSPAKKIQKMSGQTHTTSVKWKTLNPEWNEEFTFEIRLTDLMEYALVITLWDKDFGKSNDYLGGLVLCCNSKGARLNQWIDTIKFPDHRHQATHELTEDITLNKSN